MKFFIRLLYTNDLREDVYICPINATKHTTKSASCVMELPAMVKIMVLINRVIRKVLIFK